MIISAIVVEVTAEKAKKYPKKPVLLLRILIYEIKCKYSRYSTRKRITLPQAISLAEGKYNFTLQQHDSCLLAAQNSVSIPNGNLNLAYVSLAQKQHTKP